MGNNMNTYKLGPFGRATSLYEPQCAKPTLGGALRKPNHYNAD